MILSRFVAALAYAGAAFLFGVSLGERGELGVVQHLFAGIIPIASIVLAIVSKQGRAYVLFTSGVMLLGLLLGQRQFARAWTDCIANGERVRVALLARGDDYPARLEDLGIALPCRCVFRPTILRYLANERGFRLWMTNDRETYVATDKRPFTASGKSAGRSRT